MSTVCYKRISDGTYVLWNESNPEGPTLQLSFTVFKRLRDQLQTLGIEVLKSKGNIYGVKELDH